MKEWQMPYIRVLTIAGSDSGGGAGIQADLKTFSGLGVYGTSVITALTAQNTLEVRAIHEVAPAFVAEQLSAVLEDIGADAVKIGMLLDSKIVEVVANALRKYRMGPVVLDPVMVSKSGRHLLRPSAIEAMRELLFPLVSLVTPNIPEAETLLGKKLNSAAEIESAAQELTAMGPGAALIKGGHGTNPERCADCLAFGEGSKRSRWFDFPRVPTRNLHGTGCTLSAAIAAFLARGFDLEQAVQEGRAYVQNAITRGASYRLGHGHGHGPVGSFPNAESFGKNFNPSFS